MDTRKIIMTTVLCGCLMDTSACTSVIISGRLTQDGRPLMWKNRDTSNPYNCVVYQQGERYGYVAVANSNTARHPRSVWMGVNERGFAIMNTQSYNLAEPDDTLGSKANGAILKRALEICETVEDFKTLLDTLPHPLYATTNYGVIDAKGGAAYFETGHNGYQLFDVNDTLNCPKGYIARANYLVIEANHSEQMLLGGPYPQHLKERILGPNGHLSNKACGEALAENATNRLRHVWLCHLSEENNHPELARKTVEEILQQKGLHAGTDFKLDVLKRKSPSEIYELT